MCHASLRRQKEVAGMEQINVAMIPAVLAGIVKQLEAIDGWLTLKTELVLNGTSARRRIGLTSMNSGG